MFWPKMTIIKSFKFRSYKKTTVFIIIIIIDIIVLSVYRPLCHTNTRGTGMSSHTRTNTNRRDDKQLRANC
jgi:hypothetical protein